jgi:hypothetical protein
MMLQSKFEQDKKRMLQQRAARKFRPYWTLHGRKRGQELKHQSLTSAKETSAYHFMVVLLVKMVALAFPEKLYQFSHHWHYRQAIILLLEETSPFPFQASSFTLLRRHHHPRVFQTALKYVYTVFLRYGRHPFFFGNSTVSSLIKFICFSFKICFVDLLALMPGSSLAAWRFLLISNAIPWYKAITFFYFLRTIE